MNLMPSPRTAGIKLNRALKRDALIDSNRRHNRPHIDWRIYCDHANTDYECTCEHHKGNKLALIVYLLGRPKCEYYLNPEMCPWHRVTQDGLIAYINEERTIPTEQGIFGAINIEDIHNMVQNMPDHAQPLALPSYDEIRNDFRRRFIGPEINLNPLFETLAEAKRNMPSTINRSIAGDLNNDMEGSINGNVHGDINGTVVGDIFGHVFGTINGTVTGRIHGQVFNGDISFEHRMIIDSHHVNPLTEKQKAKLIKKLNEEKEEKQNLSEGKRSMML
jgi:hypothetical protein